MLNVEASEQKGEIVTEGQGRAELPVAMVAKMRDSGQESQQTSKSKASEKLEAYRKHRSVRLAAQECGVTVSRMSQVLTAERDRQGLSDMRLLYADSEDGFKTKVSADVTAKDLLLLAESQLFRCALSGVAIEPNSSSLDHIVPVSSGGSHAIGNLQWVDRRINAMKGELAVSEFVELCRAVADHAIAHPA